jgi:hypothetical protein
MTTTPQRSFHARSLGGSVQKLIPRTFRLQARDTWSSQGGSRTLKKHSRRSHSHHLCKTENAQPSIVQMYNDKYSIVCQTPRMARLKLESRIISACSKCWYEYASYAAGMNAYPALTMFGALILILCLPASVPQQMQIILLK